MCCWVCNKSCFGYHYNVFYWSLTDYNDDDNIMEWSNNVNNLSSIQSHQHFLQLKTNPVLQLRTQNPFETVTWNANCKLAWFFKWPWKKQNTVMSFLCEKSYNVRFHYLFMNWGMFGFSHTKILDWLPVFPVTATAVFRKLMKEQKQVLNRTVGIP